MSLDVLFLARDRLQFTQEAWRLLVRNTDWGLVRRLIVYDDGSEEHARLWLEEAVLAGPQQGVFRETRLRSPVGVMLDYLRNDPAEVFAKIDNDIAVPGGWLNQSVYVMEAYPELELLGLAAGWTGVRTGEPGFEASSHIGGVGLMRTSAFASRPPMRADGRHGFTLWQQKHEPVRGWIIPDVQAVQLDLVPAEPWAGLKAFYREIGGDKLQRDWPPYQDESLWRWIEEQ